MPAAAARLHPDCWQVVDRDRAELIASRCTQCATAYLPAVLACARCGNREFAACTLSPRGTLYTYSIVHGSGGVWPAVYAAGYVDFPEGVRVFGQLRETDATDLRIGAQIGVEPEVLYRRQDGIDVVCFRFYVAAEDGA